MADLIPAVPGWDFGAKVPARTAAVNDGGRRTIPPDLGRRCFGLVVGVPPDPAVI